jgi:hypothetical protein
VEIISQPASTLATFLNRIGQFLVRAIEDLKNCQITKKKRVKEVFLSLEWHVPPTTVFSGLQLQGKFNLVRQSFLKGVFLF